MASGRPLLHLLTGRYRANVARRNRPRTGGAARPGTGEHRSIGDPGAAVATYAVGKPCRSAARVADDLAGHVFVGGAHRTAGFVDDVVDGAGTAQVDREQVVHLDAWRVRD